MNYSAQDLKNFYKSKNGLLVRRILARHIRNIWPDAKGCRVMGYGYAVPYLRAFAGDAERVFAVMPDRLGIHHWPEAEAEKGLACLSGEGLLPVETESVDRILLVHGFEYAVKPAPLLHEIWRVMKSGGRLLIVAPNRLGLWARADWTPFGHGTPYTLGQISQLLQQNLFTYERAESALFMPPFRSAFVLRGAYRIETLGKYIMPGLAGVHLVEAGKQVYAGTALRQHAAAGRRVLATGAVST